MSSLRSPNQQKPTQEEVTATTLPSTIFEGWYCHNHPTGEEVANAKWRKFCWGCDQIRPPPMPDM
jgi:hypothetical protein